MKWAAAIALSAKWAFFYYEGEKIILNLGLDLLLVYKAPLLYMFLCIIFFCPVEFVTLPLWG